MQKLHHAQTILRAQGYSLKIWDSYRPPEAHWLIWKHFGATGYVHEPGYEGRWSWHCYGRAVDVTLLDRYGAELPMPSDFDDFSPRAWSYSQLHPKPLKENLHILQDAMKEAGFRSLDTEWWHFSDPLPEPLPQPVFGRDLGLKFPEYTPGPPAKQEG